MTIDRVPFVDLSAQHEALARELAGAIAEVGRHGRFVLGPEVAAFEQAFAAFVGTTFAVGVSSGLDALRIALIAAGVGEGDEVVLPANTFIATAIAVSAVGATPVLVDVDPRTFNLDARGVERALTPRTRALVPVHLYGRACDMTALGEIARRRGLRVIEDACQAHGARGVERACGAAGDAGCFSFYPSKNLGAWGDGGAIVTSDPDLAARARLLRNYGEEVRYRHRVRGFNARLDSVQAAVLGVKLPHLRRWNAERRRHARAYGERLAACPHLTIPEDPCDDSHVYHLYVVRTPRRDALRAFLAERGVDTGIHYPVPIHRQEAYPDLHRREGSLPVTERLAGEILSLPMFPELTARQIDRVTDAIREFFDR